MYPSRYDIKLYVSSLTSRNMSVSVEVSKIPPELARGARELWKDSLYFYTDMFLEVRDETYSLIA